MIIAGNDWTKTNLNSWETQTYSSLSGYVSIMVGGYAF